MEAEQTLIGLCKPQTPLPNPLTTEQNCKSIKGVSRYIFYVKRIYDFCIILTECALTQSHSLYLVTIAKRNSKLQKSRLLGPSLQQQELAYPYL